MSGESDDVLAKRLANLRQSYNDMHAHQKNLDIAVVNGRDTGQHDELTSLRERLERLRSPSTTSAPVTYLSEFMRVYTSDNALVERFAQIKGSAPIASSTSSIGGSPRVRFPRLLIVKASRQQPISLSVTSLDQITHQVPRRKSVDEADVLFQAAVESSRRSTVTVISITVYPIYLLKASSLRQGRSGRTAAKSHD
jgi:hypothetical protein